MLEEIDNVRSIYIELEYEMDVFSVDSESITKGEAFSNCDGSLLLVNENSDQFGILKINISFLGDSCNGFEGSGILVTVKMDPLQSVMESESLLKINHNSSFRDIDNNEINISNINSLEPHISRVVFP